MQLWTDYEGVMIDGVFPLRKLLMPEGRSAFFSTTGSKGEPTVVRLIECHFDEEEILARWRSVEALNHPNILEFERFGQTELDGRPVVYAVFEKVDGNLAEVLDEGHLEVKDVGQLGSSLVAALEVLHTHGFVHEHIEPRNIFNVSGVVKLRGDCIREAPDGEEGRAVKKRDVHDLATVLLQGLTRRESLAGVPDSAVPFPFGQIIRSGLDGTWGLEKIGAVLDEQFGVKEVEAPKVVIPVQAATGAAGQKAAVPPAVGMPLRNARPSADASRSESREAEVVRASAHRETGEDDESFSPRYRRLGIGLAVLLVILCTWMLAHAWSAHRHGAAQVAVVPQGTDAQAAAPAVPQGSGGAAPARAAADVPRGDVAAAAGSHAGWRVIAYTYNRRTDAEKKASDLAHSHPELQPAVFAPRGRAPYLVSIGGVMDRETAVGLARRSRSLGLPRDMYAQNYSH